MTNNTKYISIKGVLGKLYRELRNTSLNEIDVIEWIGEALDHLQLSQVQSEDVVLLDVKNYQVDLPQGFQVVRDLYKCDTTDVDLSNPTITIDEYFLENRVSRVYLSGKSYFVEESKRNELNRDNMSIPGFLSSDCDNSFYNYYGGYKNKLEKRDEYFIVGTAIKKFRFSFKEGIVILRYLKTAVDKDTGYPLIPDDIRYITAITYYVKWKIAEMYAWNGRQGFDRISAESEQKWLKYVKQAKNHMKMPKSFDDFELLKETSKHLIPPETWE